MYGSQFCDIIFYFKDVDYKKLPPILLLSIQGFETHIYFIVPVQARRRDNQQYLGYLFCKFCQLL
jgi:hypothetical protein